MLKTTPFDNKGISMTTENVMFLGHLVYGFVIVIFRRKKHEIIFQLKTTDQFNTKLQKHTSS